MSTAIASQKTELKVADSLLRINGYRSLRGVLRDTETIDIIFNDTGVIVHPGVLITARATYMLPRARTAEGEKYETAPALDYRIGYNYRYDHRLHYSGPPAAWRIDPVLPAVQLADNSQHFQVGDELTIWGYPRLTLAQWATRLLWDERYPLPPNSGRARILSFSGSDRSIVTDGELWMGYRGGAAFDDSGRLVAMVGRNFHEGQELRPVLFRVEAIHKLLSKINA